MPTKNKIKTIEKSIENLKNNKKDLILYLNN